MLKHSILWPSVALSIKSLDLSAVSTTMHASGQGISVGLAAEVLTFIKQRGVGKAPSARARVLTDGQAHELSPCSICCIHGVVAVVVGTNCIVLVLVPLPRTLHSLTLKWLFRLSTRSINCAILAAFNIESAMHQQINEFQS